MPGNEEIIEKFYQSLRDRNFDAMEEILADDYEEEYPQSGERLRGKKNARAVFENYPGLPESKNLSIKVNGDLGISEGILDYSGKPFHAVAVFELADGKVRRMRAYFGEPFEAPEWRAQWVEKVSP